jgi:hypothetical protein
MRKDKAMPILETGLNKRAVVPRRKAKAEFSPEGKRDDILFQKLRPGIFSKSSTALLMVPSKTAKPSTN